MNHVSNPTKPDTMAHIESEYHVDTTCAGKNTKLLLYAGYEYNINGFHSDLKSMEKIPAATELMVYDDPILVTAVMLVFNQAL